ncbi:MAG: hypothetical protein MI867_17670 [Pseudomonadales bacterium]|nr:hypothetical protein [Pseudomonadales bacterium]
MVGRGRKSSKFGSIKQGGLHKKKGFSKSENLGKLMNKHRQIEDVLYTYTATGDMVYEDMDFTIEEFSDMTGADLEELLEDLNNAVKVK